MPRHLHIDPFSGIAGDMFLGAALDLGVPLPELEHALTPLPVHPPYRITADRVERHGIGAVDLKVTVSPSANHETHDHSHGHRHHDHGGHTHDGHDHDHAGHTPGDDHDGHGHPHHHTAYPDIMAMVDQLNTTDRAKARARTIVTTLARAEARVHGKTLDDIHFHEVGAVDSIVDMLGSVVALEHLDVDTLSCAPLPISAGFVRCAHGLMPVPAPATAYLLEDLPTYGVDRRGELVTPTGAALVKALCSAFGPPPPMTLHAVGYGAGDRRDPDIPNLLRLFLGQTAATTPGSHPPVPASRDAASPADESPPPPHSHTHPHPHRHPPSPATPTAPEG
ncbi:MAG: LarC family nickel insertion protein [Planctomycetota bacterium]